MDENNPKYSSNDGVLFDKNQRTLICYPVGKKGHYTIPDTVITIEVEGFFRLLRLNICNNSQFG
ncbi:MAG: hypothetical protein LBE13_23125 [Bacteroidales bacterium]|nr:hypothetical protein [Bacteroidales bacterium]